ncbi:phosphate signaling complex protein PhoU [uncultured Subdoligranulum sp.]|uniref:phosphate signaling complex protein PhoU n=1 Tax=uncultured Subdoligranulum sp. TaxID=512298 RepID=UPI002603015B|nr:phosphate signaling complex protein PhoU [uncultured Subdoligranulum sp.]
MSFSMPYSSRKVYDAELLQLDTMLARMGHAAGGAIESAMTALRTGDVELARGVIARDSEIDAAEHEIEHRCLTLFLRQQPVAGDLRKVSTALKMVTDIERIADQASDIAEITLHLKTEGAQGVGVLEDLEKMGAIALRMVKDAIGAYVQVDLSVAAQVIARDDECDAMFRKISGEIAQYIAAHPDQAETALDLFMISKYLERLGDHAVNVAEWVEFLKTGVHKSRKIV